MILNIISCSPWQYDYFKLYPSYYAYNPAHNQTYYQENLYGNQPYNYNNRYADYRNNYYPTSRYKGLYQDNDYNYISYPSAR